jgi:uncharacterized membrane protein
MIVALAGGAAGVVTALFAPWQLSTLIGWDVAAALYLVWVWTSAGRFDADETKRFANREDDSRVSAQLLVLTACVASLIGVGFDLLKASEEGGDAGGDVLLISAAVATVVLSWATVHTVFALRYAHEYYARPPVGGIDFKTRDYAPDYRDFAYVAFGIGMTFQVADTDIHDRKIRHTVLLHSLLAYLFGAVILAVTINIVAAIFQ